MNEFEGAAQSCALIIIKVKLTAFISNWKICFQRCWCVPYRVIKTAALLVSGRVAGRFEQTGSLSGGQRRQSGDGWLPALASPCCWFKQVRLNLQAETRTSGTAAAHMVGAGRPLLGHAAELLSISSALDYLFVSRASRLVNISTVQAFGRAIEAHGGRLDILIREGPKFCTKIRSCPSCKKPFRHIVPIFQKAFVLARRQHHLSRYPAK